MLDCRGSFLGNNDMFSLYTITQLQEMSVILELPAVFVNGDFVMCVSVRDCRCVRHRE